MYACPGVAYPDITLKDSHEGLLCFLSNYDPLASLHKVNILQCGGGLGLWEVSGQGTPCMHNYNN